MQCYIYRSSIKDGLFVYLAQENGLDKLPAAVMKQLGTPEFSMTLELHAKTKLSQEDTQTVLENLAKHGFHVQMPRDIEHQLETISLQTTLKKQGG